MPSKPKLIGRTPDNADLNALIAQHPRLIEFFNSREHPNRHIAIVEIGVQDVTTSEGGEQTARVVIRHLELAVGAFEKQVEKLFTTIHKERTGNNARPDFIEAPTDTPLEGLGEDVDDGVGA